MSAARLKVLLASTAGVGCILFATQSQALEGLVVDGNTGKPLGGVYVIGAWRTSQPMAVVSKSGCGKLEVTRSDEQGRFVLSKWSGSVLAHFFGTENLNVYYYLRGYRWEKGFEVDRQTVELVPDARSSLDRLGYIQEITAAADCGSLSEQVKYALPLYRSMYADAQEIASRSNQADRKALSNILFMIEVLELGYQEADKKAGERFFRGYQ